MSVSSLRPRQPGAVTARIFSVTYPAIGSKTPFQAVVIDAAGDALRLEWIGRSDVPGVRPGASIRVSGIVVQRPGGLTMINPTYDLVLQESDE